MTETTVCTFHMNISNDKWFYKFYLDEARYRKEEIMKVLYRGVSKKNHHKVIAIFKANQDYLGKYIQENFDIFEKVQI